MNLFEEANAFMKAKQSSQTQESSFLESQSSREEFVRELKITYMNATNLEIEKALDWALEQTGKPYNKDQILKIIRVKLED